LNEKNDTLVTFGSFRFGMGHFDLTPQRGEDYRVVFRLPDGKTIIRSLPVVAENGYTMKLSEEAGKIRLQVNTTMASGSTEVYLLAQTRQVTKAAQRALTQNGVALFMVDKNLLGEGVSQFTVFNQDKKPVGERLYFTPPGKSEVGLQAGKLHYETREKVDLTLTSGVQENNLSLSVFQLDEWQADAGPGIDQYFWLTSELSGPVEEPAYYFSTADNDVKQVTDYLMMTQGWRRFRWEALPTAPVVKFPMEQKGHLVLGRVTDTRTQAPAKEVQVYLSVPASPYKLFTAISDSDGLVQFDVTDYYGDGEMIVQTNTLLNPDVKVEILSPYAETYYDKTAVPFALDSSRQAALVNRSIGMQALHIYHNDSVRKFYLPAYRDTLPFYGKPMYNYDLDDYVRFNTMEEVLREYVREVNVGVKGSGESLRFKLYNDTERRLYQEDILVMVDGIPQFKPNKVFDLNPLKIKSLEVIPRNYILGHANFHGLANFSSYNGHYEALELDPKAVSIDYAGLQLQREFYAPVYATEQQRRSRLPDLRTTLYWQPDAASSKISFYTGDNKGRFVAVLQGFDANGRTVSASVPFEVK
jgi:hypothetical protein